MLVEFSILKSSYILEIFKLLVLSFSSFPAKVTLYNRKFLDVLLY